MQGTGNNDPRKLSTDVARRVDLLWSDPVERRRVSEALATYGVQGYEREVDRVQLAILKLSEGNSDRALEMVTVAKRDYRDVLMWAEYPEQSLTLPTSNRSATKAEINKLEQLRRRDRKQYLEWLKKPTK